ncbi:glycosyl transferase [Microbacterium sp. SS28]|uniref:glycosyl transferase n=1 Tax=Microbacterium sp. SS28 TaxID=2919948 RepID=UPI001FAB1DAF|nr:glycosyl transferase [Microbacterium sp. SS28]
MRFVWAVAAFVLAAVMIGAGIAQRTVFQGPTAQTADISVEEEAPYTLIDGAVLNSMPGTQTIRAAADGTVFAAYGRTADLEAWLSDATYNEVSIDDAGDIEATLVEPAEESEPTDAAADPAATPATPDPAATAETTEPAQATGRNPAGSDLWLDEYQQDDLLIVREELPATMSLLVATDGTAAAPADVTISWRLTSSTPWAGPLFVIGGLLMAAGIVLYILGIRHVRRSRGPRRKGLPLPVTEPIDLAVDGADKGVISSVTPTRRGLSGGRKSFIAIPAVAVSALLFTGCSADAWPDLNGTPTPTPTETIIAQDGQQQPAVTEAQATRIIARIASTVAEADTNLDAALAATRLDGTALAERQTNYTLRAALPEHKAPAAIPTSPVFPLLPQAFDGWPRTVLAVVADEENKTANIMTLTQQDQWSDYKLSYLANLEPETTMPDLAPSYIGAPAVQPDSPFLVMRPDALAAAYADILNKGEESEFYDSFEANGDDFRTLVAANRDQRLADFNSTGAQTASLVFDSAPGASAPVALATLESGAIIAVSLTETDTATPTDAAAVIKLPNNPTVKALTGADQSATGFTTTFSDQLFFYVPSQGSTEKIRLLGYASDILDAKVIK